MHMLKRYFPATGSGRLRASETILEANKNVRRKVVKLPRDKLVVIAMYYEV